MDKKKNNIISLGIYFFLAIISFFINFYIASSGVYPVDTFIHYDSGFRILLGEHPIKDYWIVHGFLIDYIQAIFFKIFGYNWYAYIIHSSFFNLIIVLFSYYIFDVLKINLFFNIFLCICIAILAYPVSGTPFLDLHSTYFSLISIYFAILATLKQKHFFWHWSAFFICVAFFCKQVPAAYTIIGLSITNLIFSFKEKNIKIIFYYATGVVLFLSLFILLLLFVKIDLKDLILQFFLFPHSIGSSRYENYTLTFKNVFLDYKLIYLVLFFIIILNLKNMSKKYSESRYFKIFLLLLVLVITSIFHQIYTKNQIYIFFLIPICSAFVFFYIELLNLNYKKIINIFVLIICLYSTIKYNQRFNLERKFHELSNTDISKAIDASKIHPKLKGLNWISPIFKDPQEEVDYIKAFLNILEKDDENKMLISQYNFFSSILEQKLYSPSRTYDSISYPKKNTKYYKKYKSHLENLIKKNKIKKIFIFAPYSNYNLNHMLFNYIPENCFEKEKINNHLLKLEIKKCNGIL